MCCDVCWNPPCRRGVIVQLPSTGESFAVLEDDRAYLPTDGSASCAARKGVSDPLVTEADEMLTPSPNLLVLRGGGRWRVGLLVSASITVAGSPPPAPRRAPPRSGAWRHAAAARRWPRPPRAARGPLSVPARERQPREGR